MKLLIDTNILIPLDPATDAERGEAALAAEVFQRAQRGNVSVFFHPASFLDFARDPQRDRRLSHEADLAKYVQLPSPPVDADLDRLLGAPDHATNDWVDNQLIIALARRAVNLLVTNDTEIHKKARRLDLEQGVLTAREALNYLRDLYHAAPPPPPSLTMGRTHNLDENDPFFDSFTQDYPDFKDWLIGTKTKDRVCWYAKDAANRLEALCIVKKETETPPPEAIGKVLKICSLKVAEAARGRSLGEQLLKAAFAFAYENKYDTVFLTIFEDKQPRLVQDLFDFGYQISAHRLARNEGQMYKHLAPPQGVVQAGLTAHIAYGPRYVDFNQPILAVPIQPRYVEQLFPEKASQTALLPRASANAIRKAYLSMARRNAIVPGTVVAFYRSQVDQGLIVIGVVEGAEMHTTADGVAGFVGKRTVYTFREIENMVSDGPVLAIRFREARLVTPVIPLAELKARGMLKGAPQSITSMNLSEETRTWLEQRTRG